MACESQPLAEYPNNGPQAQCSAVQRSAGRLETLVVRLTHLTSRVGIAMSRVAFGCKAAVPAQRMDVGIQASQARQDRNQLCVGHVMGIRRRTHRPVALSRDAGPLRNGYSMQDC